MPNQIRIADTRLYFFTVHDRPFNVEAGDNGSNGEEYKALGKTFTNAAMYRVVRWLTEWKLVSSHRRRPNPKTKALGSGHGH